MAAPFQSPVRVKRRLTPPKPCERFPDRFRAHAEPVRDGDRGGRIQGIVLARHRHDNFFKRGLGARLAVTNDHRETRNAIAEIDAGEPDIGLRDPRHR